MTKLNLALVPTGWRAIVGAAVAKIDEIGEPWKTVVLSDRMACLDWRVRTESAECASRRLSPIWQGGVLSNATPPEIVVSKQFLGQSIAKVRIHRKLGHGLPNSIEQG